MDYTNRGHRFQLMTLAYFVIASLVISFFISLFKIELGIIPNIILSQYFMVGLAVITFIGVTHSPIKETLRFKSLPIVEILICIGIAWTIMPLLSFINILSQFFVTNQTTEVIASTLEYPMLLTLALTAVTPAVLEEFLTRSIIISNYKKHSVLIVCLLSGIFFGCIHMNINQFLYALVMGLVMCYVVMVTESVLSSMIIHFTINATGITSLYLTKFFMTRLDGSGSLMDEVMNQSANTSTTELLLSLVFIFFVMLFLTPLSVLLINTLIKRHNKSFKGSLKLPAEVFMNIMPKPEEDHTFSKDIQGALNETSKITPPVSTQKIITPVYMAAILVFLVFAVLTELMI